MTARPLPTWWLDAQRFHQRLVTAVPSRPARISALAALLAAEIAGQPGPERGEALREVRDALIDSLDAAEAPPLLTLCQDAAA